MKKIILAIFCVFSLLFGLMGNAFANKSCVWSKEANGCEFGICVVPEGKYCVECCHGHSPGSICTMADCIDEPTNNEASAPVVNTAPVTNKAVSEPVNKTSAIAAVVARGEFYILTKDGRKLTGKDVNKITLEEGTKVVTGKNGRVQLLLPDETVFTVGANSNIVIDKFVYDNDLSPRTIMANVSKGVFRWVTGTVARKDPADMKVTLPVGIIGIRGTDFETTVKPNGGGSIVLYFGQLEITEKKTGFKFLLQEGQKVTFGADGTFSRPMKGQ